VQTAMTDNCGGGGSRGCIDTGQTLGVVAVVGHMPLDSPTRHYATHFTKKAPSRQAARTAAFKACDSTAELTDRLMTAALLALQHHWSGGRQSMQTRVVTWQTR
jgi:hypothetical protein